MMAYFELILLILTIASGIVALVDKLFFEKARWQKAAQAKDFTHLSKKERQNESKHPLWQIIVVRCLWYFYWCYCFDPLLPSLIAFPQALCHPC